MKFVIDLALPSILTEDDISDVACLGSWYYNDLGVLQFKFVSDYEIIRG